MGPDIERPHLTAGGIRPSPTQTKCHDRSVSTVGQTPGDTIKCSSNYFFSNTCTTFSHNGTQTNKKSELLVFCPFSITFNTLMYITWMKMFLSYYLTTCVQRYTIPE